MNRYGKTDLGKMTLHLFGAEVYGININLKEDGGLEVYIMRSVYNGGDIGIKIRPFRWEIEKEVVDTTKELAHRGYSKIKDPKELLKQSEMWVKNERGVDDDEHG